LIENGAVYATTKAAYGQNRVSGSIGLVEMEEASYTEIDSTTDWQVWSNYLLLDCSKRQQRNN
jgi:CMP-N-acetylneuraminic acid synthetase